MITKWANELLRYDDFSGVSSQWMPTDLLTDPLSALLLHVLSRCLLAFENGQTKWALVGYNSILIGVPNIMLFSYVSLQGKLAMTNERAQAASV